ncbi:hypothetical protein ACQ4WP_24480 [Janthinobacterium sp. GB4P2]|uniref:hypothetical protein n=1 Tax=Janthinobacterium sp. GB4P2 TaxID=3424189 RepID=UPI003F26B0E6
MTSPIASVSQLVAVLQSQLSARNGATPAQAGRAKAARAAAPATYADSQLASLIDIRIRQIGPDDPRRGRQAFRIFLEVVLLSQLGEELVNDPKFYQLIDDIQAAMENDPACRPLVDEAIAHLLQAS